MHGHSAKTSALKKDDVKATIAEFKARDAGLEAYFREAFAFAVFPTVGKGGFGIGGAFGRGVVMQNGHTIGTSTMTQLTVGLQLGGQAFSEIIFFSDSDALERFKTGRFEFGAQVSAVAVTAGASANAAYNGGVAIFTLAKGGLMYEASVGGQKFTYKAL